MSTMRQLASGLAVFLVLAVLTAAPTPAQGESRVTALAIDPLTPTTLYAATSDASGSCCGLLKSIDGGATWSATPLTNVSVSALAIAPQSPTTLYAATYERGVFKSADGGATWSATGLTGPSFAQVAVDPLQPSTVYASTAPNTPGGGGSMFKSTDAGATWSAILSAAPHSPADGVLSFAIDPVTFNALYVTRGYSDGDWGQSDVYKSADGGSSWSWIANLWDAALFLVAIERRSDPLAPATLWGLYYYGLLKSTDGGPTWTDIVGPTRNRHMLDLAIDPVTEARLYAATDMGVWKSGDGGVTWRDTGLTETLAALGARTDVTRVAIDPLTPTTLYAGTFAGVFKSIDGGASWSATGLSQRSLLTSVSLDHTRVAGGSSAIATVTLATPAPPGGLSVALSSSDPAIATVPTGVTVPAGTTSRTFTVATNSVGSAVDVVISAVLDDAARSAVLVVEPVVLLSSVSVIPSTVTGGTQSTGTVILSTPAPAGGAVVALASSNMAAAAVPTSVTVAAGAMRANFIVATRVVTASTIVTISADLSGATKSAVLTVSAATTAPPPGADTLSLAMTAPRAGTTLSGTSWVVLWLNGTASTSNTYMLTVNGLTVATTPNTNSRGPVSMAWDTTKVPNGAQTIVARAVDATGKTGSTQVAVSVSNAGPPPSPIPTAPTVSFTAPAAGATVSGIVSVAVSATGGTAPYSYRLAVDGTNVPGAGPTFSWITTTFGNGSHSLSVTVTDAAGKTTTTSPRTLTVSNTTPTPPPPGADTLSLAMTAPRAGTTVSGTSWVVLWLNGTASTSNTYTLTVNGLTVATTPNSNSRGPVSMAWDTTKVPNGSQTIVARAVDSTGKTGSTQVAVSVSNAGNPPSPTPTAPTVSFTAPAAGATVSGTMSVAVSATGGTVPYSYQLTVDGTTVPGAGPTFSWITTTSSNGSHSLNVTVTDADGKAAATGPRTVTVSNTTEPPPSAGADTLKLVITSPKTSTSAMGTSWVVLWLEGTTSASNTYTLMVNGQEVASMPNSSSRGPISMAWDSTKVPNGQQTITARVLDSTGNTASASVTVNVSNPTQ